MIVRGVAAAVLVVVLASFAATARAAGPLDTAIFDPETFAGPEASTAFARTRAAGATSVRLALNWIDVAPGGSQRPAAFDAADPSEPRYRWAAFDQQVRLAVANRLTPIVSIQFSPVWAQGPGEGPDGVVAPRPAEFGLFAKAAARRYGGGFGGLPRVRYWQAWNEPNIGLYFLPQFVNGEPASPRIYREMVNEFAASVKSVHSDNVVVAGNTAPFRDLHPSVLRVHNRWGPLTFMRELLCLSQALQRTCNAKVAFDVWAHHPYTSGGPQHTAVLPDDVSLGDLPEMRRVLSAGVRTGAVVSRAPVRFWVTEFSWDSNPPDTCGVPTALLTRWVAEALYRMWTNGVSLVTWFLLRDEPLTKSFYQSGLYYRGEATAADRPKPALRAFRFPFVGLRDRGRVLVWGRTPVRRPGRVLVEQSFRGGWKKLGVLRADANGIFQQRFRSAPVGSVRARLVTTGERAVPFSLAFVPDRFFNPFGHTVIFEHPEQKANC